LSEFDLFVTDWPAFTDLEPVLN